MDYSELRLRITNWNNDIPPSTLDTFINQALRQIYDFRKWGFLIDSSQVLIAPAMLLGSVVVAAQYDNFVTVPIGALKTAIDAIGPNNVPIIGRQLRTETGSTAPRRVYTILDYDNLTGILTLTEPYYEIAGTIDCKIFKSIYTAPQRNIAVSGNPQLVNDFKQLLCVVDLNNQYQLNLNRSMTELNRLDPSRWCYSAMPTELVPTDMTSDGQFQYELYPYYANTVYDKVFKVIYVRNGLAFENETDNLPYYMDANLIVEGAKIRACEWAEANKGNNPSLQKTNWMNLRAILSQPATTNQTGYQAMLMDAQFKDETAFPQSLIRQYMDLPSRECGIFNDAIPYPYGYDYSQLTF